MFLVSLVYFVLIFRQMVRENSLPFLLNFTNESDNVLIMCVSLQNQPLNKVMTKKEEDELARWTQGKDVTEVLAILMRSGTRYNRRI